MCRFRSDGVHTSTIGRSWPPNACPAKSPPLACTLESLIAKPIHAPVDAQQWRLGGGRLTGPMMDCDSWGAAAIWSDYANAVEFDLPFVSKQQ